VSRFSAKLGFIVFVVVLVIVSAPPDTFAQSTDSSACVNALNGNTPSAGRLCDEAARGGSRTAMYYLGHMYREGHFVAQDFEMAVYWLEQAAQAGVTIALPAWRRTQEAGPGGLPPAANGRFMADERAVIAMGLFANGCAANFATPTKLGEWVDAQGYMPVNPEGLAAFLGENQGVGWSASSHAGEFVITFTGADRACTVWARRAGDAEIEQRFRNMIGELQRQGLRVENEAEQPVTLGGFRYRQLAYYVQAPRNANAALYMMLVAEDQDAPAAARLVAAPVALKP
jgi:TPR repeat protein